MFVHQLQCVQHVKMGITKAEMDVLNAILVVRHVHLLLLQVVQAVRLENIYTVVRHQAV